MTNPVSMKKTIQIQRILTELKDDINALLGFHEDIPRINYGPCAVLRFGRDSIEKDRFVDLFYQTGS